MNKKYLTFINVKFFDLDRGSLKNVNQPRAGAILRNFKSYQNIITICLEFFLDVYKFKKNINKPTKYC